MSTDKEKFNALVNNTSDVEEGEIPDQESLSSAANSKRGKENPKLKVLRSRSPSSSSSGSVDSEESNKGWWKKKKVKREGESASSHDYNSDDSDDEEIIEQPIADQNYHRKGWNNKKDFRDKKHQHKNKQGYRQNKLPHKKEPFDSKFSRKSTQHDLSPQNDFYPCKYFIAYGKCDNPTCKNVHSPLVREQEIQRFVNENENFFFDIFKRLHELNLSSVLVKVLMGKFGGASQVQSNTKPMPPPKNIGQPNVYLPPQGPLTNNNFNTFQGQNLLLKPTQMPNQGNMTFNYPAPNLNPSPIHNPQYNPQPFAPGGPNNIQHQNFNYNQPPREFTPHNFAETKPNIFPRMNPNQSVNQYLPSMANKHQPYQPQYNQPQGPPMNFQGGFPNQRYPPGNYPAPNIEGNIPRAFNPSNFLRQENLTSDVSNYPEGGIDNNNRFMLNEDISLKKPDTPSPVKTGSQPAEEAKTEAQDQIAKFHEKMKNFGIFKTQEEPKVPDENRELSKEELKSAAEAAIISKFANGSINDQILKQIKGVLPQYQSQSPEDIKNLVNMYLKLSKDPRFSK